MASITSIRRAVKDDAINIIAAHIRSIREICSKEYSAEQIQAWAGRDFKVERWHQSIEKDLVWVVDQDGIAQGFGHLILHPDKKIAVLAGLYFSPNVKGQGLGKSMFEFIQNECLNHNITKIFLESTLTSHGFYKRLGFNDSENGHVFVTMQGVQVPCIKMEKII